MSLPRAFLVLTILAGLPPCYSPVFSTKECLLIRADTITMWRRLIWTHRPRTLVSLSCHLACNSIFNLPPIKRQCPQYGEVWTQHSGLYTNDNEVLTHLSRRFKLEVINRRWFESSWIEQRVNRRWEKLYSTPSIVGVFIRLSCAQTM